MPKNKKLREMNVRPIPQRRTIEQSVADKKPKHYFRLAAMIGLAGILIWLSISVVGLGRASADSPQPQISSGVTGDYCIDDYHGNTKPGSIVDSWQCNGTSSQKWSVSHNNIKLMSKYCLAEITAKLVVNKCDGSKNEQWVRRGVGFKNLADNNCLSLPSGKTSVQLVTTSCNSSSLNQVWTPNDWPGLPMSQISSPACNQRTLGQRVACYAKRQWLAWQTEPSLHNILINEYTDGNSYEEWCADFVSYIYREAGAPFVAGERGNGWDEYNANNIQYMGFTYHAVNSGYVPKPGDVAYFNYSGGHVEIVVSGGAHPTFIYGDSGAKDPYTHNGDMAENQLTSDGSSGQLMYYLSPN